MDLVVGDAGRFNGDIDATEVEWDLSVVEN